MLKIMRFLSELKSCLGSNRYDICEIPLKALREVIVDFQYIKDYTQYFSEIGYPFLAHRKYSLCPPVIVLIINKET